MGRRSTWLRNVLGDGTANACVYTVPMATIEAVTGMDADTIVRSRISNILLGYAASGLYGPFRGLWARLWRTNKNSSALRKQLTDAGAFVAFNGIIYFTILEASGAKISETGLAVPLALTFATLTGGIYGRTADRFRESFGGEPLLYRRRLEDRLKSFPEMSKESIRRYIDGCE